MRKERLSPEMFSSTISPSGFSDISHIGGASFAAYLGVYLSSNEGLDRQMVMALFCAAVVVAIFYRWLALDLRILAIGFKIQLKRKEVY